MTRTTPVVTDDVLVVVDQAPTLEVGADRTAAQLLHDLRSLLVSARIVLARTEAIPRGRPPIADRLNLEAPAPESWSDWLDENRFRFSIVILAGAASTERLLSDVRRTQPQATVAALLGAVPCTRAGDADRFPQPEERRGSEWIIAEEQRADHAFLASIDAALVADDTDRQRAQGVPGLRVLRYADVPRALAQKALYERRGAVSWGSFAIEQGDPDEDAAAVIIDDVTPTLASIAPSVGISVLLENPPTGFRHLAAGRGDLEPALSTARALVVARSFGPPPRWLITEAVELGTPIVALRSSGVGECAVLAEDAADLARKVARVCDDDAAWHDALLRLRHHTPVSDPASNHEALLALIEAAGVVGNVAATPGPPPFEERRSATQGPHTVQGQIRTPGFAEFRPTAAAYKYADLPPNDLWPAIGYESWFDAHPLTEEAIANIRGLAASFERHPTVSLVMPVYNTDPDVLEAAVESVRQQTYPMWELCIVDDASTDHRTMEALAALAQADARIKTRRLDENAGIVGASNAALDLATGEFVGLLDHDDVLTPDALFEVVRLVNEEPDLDYVYSDEDKFDTSGARVSPFFKPSWSPHLHLCVNYVTHFSVYRRTLIDEVGMFRPGFDGSQDYDLSLRATEAARRIGHIAKPIYAWRMVPGSTAVAHDAKPYALDAARRALNEALARRGIEGHVERGLVPGTWRPRYKIRGTPLVSLLIPTRNGRALLERCLESVNEKTDYDNYEIVIVDNGSDEDDTLDYLRAVKARVVRYPYRFNYARQMNLAVLASAGDHVLFLNNDVEILTRGWLGAMVELGQDPAVGAVGAKLVFPSGRPQHEGVFIGYGGGSAGNVDFGGYFGLGDMIRDATAVTAACMLMRREAFRRVGGFDERLRVAFNDVDLCLRLRQAGYQIVYTPYAQLIHAESASRGKLHPAEDEAFFTRRWGMKGDFVDPFYNPNLDPSKPFRLAR